MLSELNLPSEYEKSEKIKLTLKDQSYKARIQLNLSKTEWQTFETYDFGLEHDEKSHHTYVLGVSYQQLEEEKLFEIYDLDYIELI